jgi:hypothetical protein
MRYLLLVLPFVLFTSLAPAQPPPTNDPARPADSVPAQTSQGVPIDQENARKAKAVLDRMVQALGGPAYLQIHDLSQQGRTYSFYHGQSTSVGTLFWRFYKYPDRERIELTKQRDVAYLYNGDKGYEITYKGTALEDEKTLTDYIRRRQHSLDWVIRKWLNEPGIALFYEGSTVAEERPAEQVTILSSKNDSVTLFVGTDNHLPVKKTYSWRDPADKLRTTEDEVYDGYRNVQGIMTPFSVTRFLNGEMSNQRFLNSVTYNSGVSDSLFNGSITYDPSKPPPKR